MKPRYYLRVIVQGSAVFTVGGFTGEGQVLDLTVPGCLIDSPLSPNKGDLPVLRMIFPRRAPRSVWPWARLLGAGVMLRGRVYRDGPTGAGVVQRHRRQNPSPAGSLPLTSRPDKLQSPAGGSELVSREMRGVDDPPHSITRGGWPLYPLVDGMAARSHCPPHEWSR